MTRTVMDPEERRRELLACAMRLFAEEGYDNVSVRAVARAAGVAPGLAYHYFDSKEKMFAEAIGDYARRCAEGINAVLDEEGLPLDERLDRVLAPGGALVVGEAWQPAPARAIMNAWMPHSREGDVRIYSEAEMRRILGTWFSDVSWRRVGQTACVAVARKGR